MSDRSGSLANSSDTDSHEVEYANDLYIRVLDLCHDWQKVNAVSAPVIIEYAKDALAALGNTNPEKRVELKEILDKAEQFVPPDSIESLRKRSERLVIHSLYPINRKHRYAFLIAVGILSLLSALFIPLSHRLRDPLQSSARQESVEKSLSPNQASNNAASQREVTGGDEAQVVVERAVVTLDLTSAWVELNDDQRLHERLSEGILKGVFYGVRKLNKNATFIHRVGTTSNFKPDWRNISPHPVTSKDELERKCNPNTKYAYTLTFDISKEKVNVPFDLKYEIDFWNAHNGEKGDWQSFFVSRPLHQLIMRVTFPVTKPYTHLYFKHAYGIDCQSADFRDFPNPNIKETIDEVTGAKVLTWTIDSPQDLWIYEIGWDW